MYCGLCSEPCPTGSIHHTTEFEGADYSLESLIRRFVKDPVIAYKPKKGPETDPQIAPILNRGLRYLDQMGEVSAAKSPAEDSNRRGGLATRGEGEWSRNSSSICSPR